MEENRKLSRADFNANGYIQNNGTIYNFDIVNISLKGILVNLRIEAEIELQETIKLVINLISSNIEISTKAILLHKENNQYGFRFEEIDLESLMHLRRLLELNSIDPDKIVEELSFL